MLIPTVALRAVLRTTACAGALTLFALLSAVSAGAVTITSAAVTTRDVHSNARNVGVVSDEPFCGGAPVVINGAGFVTDGGVVSVSIGNAPAGSYEVGSDSVLYARVGRNATTGPIVVTTKAGRFSTVSLPGGRINADDGSPQGRLPGIQILECPVTSYASKVKVKAVVTEIKPNPAKGGRVVQLTGYHFHGLEKVTVGGKPAAFLVANADGLLRVVVPRQAKDGKLTVVLTKTSGVTTKVVLVKTG